MKYFKDLTSLFSKIEANDDKRKSLSFAQATAQVIHQIKILKKKDKKIILIGNGGSASIAGHIATDFLKNAGIRALCFNEPSLITCISNDFGYEYVFQKPLAMLAEKGDMVVAVSSSGRSKNILNAVEAAQKKGCFVITMSGFSPKNPLRFKGKINFYVPARLYGYVEIAHLAICHSIADSLKI